MVKKKAKKNGKGKPKEDEESFEEDSEEEKPKSKARKNKKAPIKNSTPIVKVEDNKVMVDEKFKDKNKYHVLQDDNNVYNGKYFSCKLLINENNSNKYFIIQLLKNDSKNSFSLFTRWGKIGSDGQQKVESVDSTSGPKLFMKKYTEKINKGFIEEAGEKKVENGTKKSNHVKNYFSKYLSFSKRRQESLVIVMKNHR
jgi:poly [ADP-ribose] polymerase